MCRLRCASTLKRNVLKSDLKAVKVTSNVNVRWQLRRALARLHAVISTSGAFVLSMAYVQGVQFDLDSPLTLRLEFARSNTKTTSTKPQQQQQQQQSTLAASSKSSTAAAACLHHASGAVSVASLTGCESTVLCLPSARPDSPTVVRRLLYSGVNLLESEGPYWTAKNAGDVAVGHKIRPSKF